MKILKFFFAAVMSVAIAACSDDEPEILGQDVEEVPAADATSGGDYAGFYVLNEGNMGSNKCTLDYYDYDRHTYIRNIYAERNPEVVMSLGDTGSDMAIYGDRLYIVVNGSHKVEILDARSARRIGQVDVSSPRRIAFDGKYAYVTSFVGGDNDKGSLVRIDLDKMAADGSLTVGYCPEGVVAKDGKLYVANSQLYSKGIFDNTITVVDAREWKVDYTITAEVNLCHILFDQYDQLWVNSKGNYADIASCLMCIRKDDEGRYTKVQKIDIVVENMIFAKNHIYYYGNTYDESWNVTSTYGSVTPSTSPDALQQAVLTGSNKPQTPYCMAVNPDTQQFYITDAKNYTSSGSLSSFDKTGKYKWTVTTGDIPGHITFLKK